MKKKIYLSDLQLYKNGQAVIGDIIIHSIQEQKVGVATIKSLNSETKLFSEAHLTLKDIAQLLFKIRRLLMVPFSYTILLDQGKDATISDLTNSVWKSMLQSVKYN